VSPAALARVIADAAPALLGYFAHRVAVREDAADLVGETLEQAWKSARRAPADPEAARMWLFGIARNTLRHHVRGSRRRDALVDRLAAAVRTMAVTDRDAALDVRAAVAALPAEQAELIRLVHWDGFTVEDAARHLGIPASTARSRHARAKERLRAALVPVSAARD
jgi:RNA polymerase sigma factor, sigma-70 family